MGPMAPHFRGVDTEQRAMVAGAEARLREYRRMLPGGDLLLGEGDNIARVPAANYLPPELVCQLVGKMSLRTIAEAKRVMVEKARRIKVR